MGQLKNEQLNKEFALGEEKEKRGDEEEEDRQPYFAESLDYVFNEITKL